MSVKDFLFDIEKIRDVLRSNTPSITGMESIKHIIIYLLHRIFDTDLCQKYNIPVDLSWNNLLKLGENDNQWSKARENLVDLISFFDKLFSTRDIILKNSTQVHEKIVLIFKKYDVLKITQEANIDLIGAIYELHLKTGSSNARDLGQFFTSREVVNYMIDLCNPKVPEKICDPSCGSGGFLSCYLKRFDYDWNKYQDLIHGNDTDMFVLVLSKINLFLESKGIIFNNLNLRNSIYEGLISNKYDIILANMPFGLKSLKYDECCKEIKELKIPGTKSEVLFLQLILQNLNENGRCAVIVPESILNNSNKHSIDTRKYLLENFNLRKVIKMKGKYFLNTTIQTFILYFENSGFRTGKVKFYEIEGTEKIEEKFISSINANDFVDFKIEYKIEEKKKYNTKTKKLDEILEKVKGPTHKVSEGQKEGKYRLICSSMKKIAYLDTYDYKEIHLIVGNGGAANIHLLKKFSISNHMWIFRTKDDNVNIQFIFEYLKVNIHLIEELFRGIGIKNIRIKDFLNLEIPIPNLEIQDEIIKNLNLINSEILELENEKQNLELKKQTLDLKKYKEFEL